MTTSAPAGDIFAQAGAIQTRLQAVTSPATQAQIAQSLAFQIADLASAYQSAIVGADASIAPPPAPGTTPTRTWIASAQPPFAECDRACRFAASQIAVVVTTPPNTALIAQLTSAFGPTWSSAPPLPFGVLSTSFTALQARVSAAQALCAQSGAVCTSQSSSPAAIATWVSTAYGVALSAWNAAPAANLSLVASANTALLNAMAAGSQFLAAASFQ